MTWDDLLETGVPIEHMFDGDTETSTALFVDTSRLTRTERISSAPPSIFSVDGRIEPVSNNELKGLFVEIGEED